MAKASVQGLPVVLIDGYQFLIIRNINQNNRMKLEKSIAERFLHALIFEVLAIAICAPLGA